MDSLKDTYLELTATDCSVPNDSKTKREWTLLRNNIRKCLNGLNDSEKFKYGVFNYLFQNNNNSGWRVEEAARAFEHLEYYIRLLRLYPWKNEFRTLKTYSGFYRTMVADPLPDSERILRIIGYEPSTKLARSCSGSSSSNNNAILKLTSAPNVKHLQSLGFDCLVASVECERLCENHLLNLGLKNLDMKVHINPPHHHKQIPSSLLSSSLLSSSPSSSSSFYSKTDKSYHRPNLKEREHTYINRDHTGLDLLYSPPMPTHLQDLSYWKSHIAPAKVYTPPPSEPLDYYNDISKRRKHSPGVHGLSQVYCD